MYIRYPVRNFKCPFCGTRMPTEEYRGWKPWKCPGCSAALQFSEAYGYIVQVCFFGVALLSLSLLGLRGWRLVGAVVLAGSLLTVVLTGPLHRVIPPPLEPYRPPAWKRDRDHKFVTLFPRGQADPGSAEGASRHRHEPPSGLESADGPQKER